MNVLVTGASGLIGTAVSAALSAGGNRIIPLRRGRGPAPCWDPQAETISLGDPGADAVTQFDAVVHLAGENVGARWTAARRRRIRESRVGGTRLLCETIVRLKPAPRVLICASAIGFYGEHGDEWVEESSPAGTGFLAEVCREWERSTVAADAVGIRVVHLRFGIVLAKQGGALAKMLPVFRCGLGGRVGDGQQYWSWIELEDAVRAVQHALETEKLSGAVNVTAPNPVTNRQFTAALGRVLRRPTVFAVPGLFIRAVLGDMGREALLSGVRVRPAKLLASGFQFQFPDLDSALRAALR